MFIKGLLEIPFTEWSLRLHKIVRPDKELCWHTHPAVAYRFILRGGYAEEVAFRAGDKWFQARVNLWLPGDFGRVAPDLCHRVDWLPHAESWSLWLRGPRTHPVYLNGRGWGAKERPSP